MHSCTRKTHVCLFFLFLFFAFVQFATITSIFYKAIPSLWAAWNIELINKSIVCWALTTEALSLLKAKQSEGQTNILPEVIFMMMYRNLIACLVWLVITMLVRHKHWATLGTQPHLAFGIRTTGQDNVAYFCISLVNFISLSMWNIYSQIHL